MGFFEWNDDDQQPGDFTPIPEGDYIVCLRKAEDKETKAGTGRYISGEFTVEAMGSGEVKYAGRKLWHIFNVENPSEKAQNIGRGQLSALAAACGYSKENLPPSPEALCDRPIKIKVGVRYSKFKEADENFIKTFYKPKSMSVAELKAEVGRVGAAASVMTEEVPEYSGTKPSFSPGK